MFSNVAHPFQDPAELMRAMKMGWAIRGLGDYGVVDVKDFQDKCIGGMDYDVCRQAEGSVVTAARAHYGITKPLPIPTPQSSAPIGQLRP